MKASLLLLLCLAGAAWAAEPAIPAAMTAEHYRPIWTRSPFTVGTPTTTESATWVLTGLAEGGSKPLVFLLNKQNQERMSVTMTANDKGFAIVSIDYNPNPLLSAVKVKTPAETLTLRFDPAQMTVTNLPALAPGQPGSAGGVPRPLPASVHLPGGRAFQPRQPAVRTTIPNPIAPEAQPAPAPAPDSTPAPTPVPAPAPTP